MRTNRNVIVLLAIVAGISVLRDVSAQTPVQLKPGDLAPPFSLVGSDGRTYSLASFRGKEAVVLVWFVKAFAVP
jgi:peroxiredoxin Q/BCP